MAASSGPLLLVVDGNSLTHRAYHAAATGRHLDTGGHPVWALRGLVGSLARLAARVRPDAVLVGFDCPDRSVRKGDYPDYKAQRADKPADLAEQLDAAPDLLRAAGLSVTVPDGYEADDVLASAAAKAGDGGWRTVLVTSDRDAFALVDTATSVLRVRNGGLDRSVLVTALSLPVICGVEPGQYRDYAALCGDPSDNLPGAPGFGPSTAARLLAAFGSLDAAWAVLDAEGEERLRAVVGRSAAEQFGVAEVREAVARNRRLMRMRTDLPLPDLDAMRLPADLLTMRRALAGHDINLSASLWALTGGRPPLSDEDLAFVWPRRGANSARARRVPGPGQLALF